MSEATPRDQLQGMRPVIVGQALCLGAWLAGVVGAMTSSPIGWVGALAGLAGLIVSAIGFFAARPRWRGLGLAAGIVLVTGMAAAVIAYVAIPAGPEWGKLGAILMAVMILGGTIAVAHLVAAIGVIVGRQPALGGAATGTFALALVAAVALVNNGDGFGWMGILAMVVGHVLLLVAAATARA